MKSRKDKTYKVKLTTYPVYEHASGERIGSFSAWAECVDNMLKEADLKDDLNVLEYFTKLEVI